MSAIPMTSDTNISPPTFSCSKLKRSPYLSSMCVDNNGRSQTTATTTCSPKQCSIHRHRHGHSPRPATFDVFELRRPVASHPYLLPEDGSGGDSCPSSAASTEIAGNRGGRRRRRPRRGGGKITVHAAAAGTKKSLSSSSASAGAAASPSFSSAPHLRYYYPHPFGRANSLEGAESSLSGALDRIRLGDTSTSSASSSISSCTSGDHDGDGNGRTENENGKESKNENHDGTNDTTRSRHEDITNWMQRHYNPSRNNFFRKVLDPMDGPSGDVNKAVRNELWKEILLLDDDDENDDDSSLVSNDNLGKDANAPSRYSNRRRISSNSISNGGSRINLASSFRSASRISFSSLSSVASAHSLPVLLTGSGIVADSDGNGNNSTNEDDDGSIVPETPFGHDDRRQPQAKHVDTHKKNALLPTSSRNGARVARVPATTTPNIKSAKRRSASHAGLAYGTEYCREGHGSFASLSGSLSLLASVAGGGGSTAGVGTSRDQ